ncbi:hypothetical protein C8R43DRAFT_1136911 [Mycena crocata]|nr:hypothetical protein C8R43DRAFT_1136911 [Mycena crocata]
MSMCAADLHCVESLLIHDLDRAAFEHIASLPSLTSLTVEALELFPELSTSSPLSDTPLFPNLAALDITTETVRNCNSLLKASSASPLATIDIVVATQRPAYIDDIREVAQSHMSHVVAFDFGRRGPFGPEFHEKYMGDKPYATLWLLRKTLYSGFLQHLGAHSPSEPMRVLQLVALVAEPDATPALYGRKHTALQHLFSFRNLVAVYLEIPDGFSPDDALLDEMAHASPHLTTLVMEPNTPCSIPRRATLAALCSFAQHCPDLNTLRIELTAMHVPPLDPQTAVVKRNVHTLGVGYAPITDADAVAGYIFGIFSNVMDLVLESFISEEGYSDQWLAVQEGLDLRRRGGEVTD